MKGLDANILVRFLVGDDSNQAAAVYSLFKAAEAEKKELFVSLLVLLELIWVLEAVYDIQRTEILDSIQDLTLMPILKFERHALVQQFINAARGNNCDLSDLLIACSAKTYGCEKIITFDKKAARHELFEQP